MSSVPALDQDPILDAFRPIEPDDLQSSASDEDDTAQDDARACVILYDPAPYLVDLYRAGFDLVLLQPHEGGLVVRDERHGTELDYPPQPVVAIIGPQGWDLSLAEAWAREAGVQTSVLQHTPGLEQVLALQADRERAAAQMNAELMLRLAEIRTVHEELHNSYDSLRSYLGENGLVPPRLGFTNPVPPETLSVPVGVTEIVQPIPVELRALCGISLHLEHASPPFSEGRLTIELLAADDDSVHTKWQAPYSAFKAGWVTFAFEQNNGFLRKNPLLRLRYATYGGHGPLFSLGGVQLRHDKSACIDGQWTDRALVFKAWTSIPGAPLNVTDQMWPVLRIDNRPVNLIELVLDAGLAVSDTRRLQETEGYPMVVVLPERQRLMVHPVDHAATAGRVHEACPPGTLSVTAEVETDNAQAGRIEYAVAVVPCDLSPDEYGQPPAGAMVSDWVNLPSCTEGMVQLLLAEPLQEACDLYLMTRLPQGAVKDFCWAHFKRVRIKGQFV